MRPAATPPSTIPTCAASGSRSPRSTPRSATSRATSPRSAPVSSRPARWAAGWWPSPSWPSPATRRRTCCSSRPSSRPISGRWPTWRTDSAGLTAVVGFVDKRDDIFNAAAVLHDGALAGIYHKQYLPNYGVFDENRYFQAGTEAPVFELGETSFAVNICEDIWYPTGPDHAAGPGRRRAGGDHQRLAVPRRQGHQPRADAHHPRGRRPRVPGLRQHGGRPGRAGLRRRQPDRQRARRAGGPRAGRSRRTSSSPTSTSTPSSTRACTTRGGARRSCGPPRRSRRIALPAPSADGARRRWRRARRSPLPPVDEVYEALVLGTRDYVRKNGFKHVVIGLSGGIDSALVAAIAVDALGTENVIGVTMPSPYSSAGTRGDAGASGARTSASTSRRCRSRRVFKALSSGRWPRRSRGSRRTWPRRTSRPASAARCSWRSPTSSAGWC